MVEEKLLPFLNNENKPSPGTFSLESIKRIMKEVKNPHLEIKTIHVAGTNGKGSVVQFLGHIFRAAGYRTGCYTSPHLKYTNERIQINGIQIPDKELEKLIDTICDILKKGSFNATYFDILTAAAFIYFKDKNIDIAIIETGLGGRLDSTNIICPLLSIITSISYDHMEFLGETLSEITKEKAGIIKKGIPVITCNTDKIIKTILETTALKKGASFHVLDRDFSITDTFSTNGSTSFTYKNQHTGHKYDCSIASPVMAQTVNAGIALYAVELLRDKYPYLKDLNLSDTIVTARLAGRFLCFSEVPLILFDPAHNEAGLLSLYAALETTYNEKRIISIITLMKDKNTHSMIEIVKKYSEKVYYLRLKDKRNFSPEISDPRFCRVISGDPCPSLLEEIKRFSGENIIVLFTGSFRIYEAAEKISTQLNL